jgi:hypothetical protein
MTTETIEAPEAAAAESSPAAPAAAPAPAAAAPAPSLLQRGAAAAPPPAAAAPAAAPAAPATIPEKFIVKREDGTVDHEATALKIATEGYAPLERRLHAGDAPPKAADDYAPTLPDGFKLDDLKKDPLYTGFLKGAHARGMTNAQLSYVLEGWAQREQMRSSPEVAEAELRKDWPDDATLQAGLVRAFRATAAYAGNDETRARLEAKFSNDPDFIRLMSRIGGEMAEDKPAAGLNVNESETLDSLMKHPAYFDAKHPEHGMIVSRTKALYAKKTGGT